MDRYQVAPLAPLEVLREIRVRSDAKFPLTVGLDDEVIQQFCNLDSKLVQAIEEARERYN